METIGHHLKQKRILSNLTQEKLAEKVKITPKYIQFIESAKRKPSLKTLYRIARALKVKVKDLMPF